MVVNVKLAILAFGPALLKLFMSVETVFFPILRKAGAFTAEYVWIHVPIMPSHIWIPQKR
jgi:hypothetical protein